MFQHSVHTTPEEFENGGITLKTHQMFSVHTTLEEFENGGFTLKTHQMFSVNTTLEEFENGGFTLKTYQMFSVNTTLEEFENGGFTLKTHQMFSVHTSPEEFENGGFTLKTQQMFSVHTTPEEFESRRLQISSDLKSVFEKLCFHDGLVWTVGLTVEIKLRCKISAAQYRRRLRPYLFISSVLSFFLCFFFFSFNAGMSLSTK